MTKLRTLKMEIDGLGFVVYSPFAMSGVATRDRFLHEHYTEPEDVAASVRAGRLAGFCTGAPGTYNIELVEGALDLPSIAGYPWFIRLALEVRDQTVCIRDLYDFSRWDPSCPAEQTLQLSDGFYRLTVATRPTHPDDVGEDQDIIIAFEAVAELPSLTWEGVPFLGDPEEDDA